MALTIAIEGLGVLSDAESTTGWGITGSGGLSMGTDTEIYYQGSACNSVAISSGKNGWVWYNYGSGLNFQSTYAGQRVYIWFNITTVGSMNTKATPGLAIRIGTNTTNFRTWTLAGSDDLHGYKGGWRCVVIDPTLTGSIADTGTYNTASLQYFGIYYNGSGSARSNNVFVDTIAIGKGVRVYGTSSESIGDMVSYCTDLSVRAWGMVQQREGINYIYGTLYFGGNASNDTVASTSGKVLQWGDSEYWNGSNWVTSMGNGFNGLTIDDHASHKTEFSDGVLVGSNAGRSGNVYIGASTINTTFDLYGGNHADSLTYFYGTIFQNITGAISWGNDADHRCYSVTFQSCAQFDPVGAIKIRNSLFISTASTSGALLWNESMDISNCRFISNTVGAGIKMPGSAGTPYAYGALFFSGNTYDVNNTSGSAISINKNSNSDPTTYTGSAVTFLGVSVTTLISVTDIDSGDPIQYARVLAVVADGSNFPYQDSVTITSTGTTATVSHALHGLATGDWVVISGAVEPEYNGVFEITYIDSGSYSYTMNGDPTSPATGTIVSTLAIIHGQTDINGEITDIREVPVDQILTGWVRMATGSYYKQSPVTGTIDNATGTTINVQLIPDI